MYGDISLRDYEGLGGGFYGGFAGRQGPLEKMPIEEFKKALAANYQSPRVSGSGALRVESLEATLRVLTYRARHIVLFHDVPKAPTYSTVHEFNQQTSYGVENGAFVRAGEAPQVQESSFVRKFVPVKYLATQREVDHPTSLVRSAHGDVIAMYTANGALWLMKMAEKAMYNGRSDCVPEEYDGYDRLLREDSVFGASNILDLRGGPLSYDKLEEGANIIEEAYGEATDLYLSMRALSDLGKQQHTKERIVLPAPQAGVIGMALRAVQLQSNEVNLKKSIFLRPGKDRGSQFAPASATAVRAPSSIVSVVGSITAAQGTLFATSDIGTYQYKVAARNRFGSSAGVQEAGGVAVTASGDRVNLVITDGGGGDTATCYDIYRSAVGGAAGTEKLIMSVPRVPGAATTTAYDVNRFLPGKSRAFMFQMNEECVGLIQLAPMFKIPFGTQALSMRWAQGMYIAPIARAPQKYVIFDNVNDD